MKILFKKIKANERKVVNWRRFYWFYLECNGFGCFSGIFFLFFSAGFWILVFGFGSSAFGWCALLLLRFLFLLWFLFLLLNRLGWLGIRTAIAATALCYVKIQIDLSLRYIFNKHLLSSNIKFSKNERCKNLIHSLWSHLVEREVLEIFLII